MPTPVSAPLLTYAFATFPTPLPVSPPDASEKARLTIVATNLTATSVSLEQLIIDLPVGPQASKLTNNAASIRTTYPAGWRVDLGSGKDGSVRFFFLPPGAQNGFALAKGSSLSFVFEDLEPNAVVGVSRVLVRESKVPDESIQSMPLKELEVAKYPPNWGRLTFELDKLHVQAGEEVKLSWNGPAGPVYKLEYQDYASDIPKTVNLPITGRPAFSHQGSYPGRDDQPRLTPMRPTTYTLIVTDTFEGAPRTAQLQLAVDVTPIPIPAPHIVEFRVEPPLIIVDGSPIPAVRLSWRTTAASSFIIDSDDSQPQIAEGSKAVYPTKSRRYSARAYPLKDSRERTPATAVTGVVFAEYIKTDRENHCHVELASKEYLMTSTSGRDGDVYKCFLNLSQGRGFTVADLGVLTERPTLFKPSYVDIINKEYHSNLQNRLYMSGRMGSTAFTMHIAKGQTWAIRLSSTRLGILYYDGLKGDDMEFLWIWCDDAYHGQLLAEAPQPSEA